MFVQKAILITEICFHNHPICGLTAGNTAHLYKGTSESTTELLSDGRPSIACPAPFLPVYLSSVVQGSLHILFLHYGGLK